MAVTDVRQTSSRVNIHFSVAMTFSSLENMSGLFFKRSMTKSWPRASHTCKLQYVWLPQCARVCEKATWTDCVSNVGGKYVTSVFKSTRGRLRVRGWWKEKNRVEKHVSMPQKHSGNSLWVCVCVTTFTVMTVGLRCGSRSRDQCSRSLGLCLNSLQRQVQLTNSGCVVAVGET